jgi:dephospho-CoA kinase
MKLKEEFVRLVPDRRLYKLKIPAIGLTGGIASGKSTVSQMLKDKGLAVVDADRLVKEIYSLPETLAFIQKEFPDVIQAGSIQFHLLRQKVFSDIKVKATVENFIYQRLPQTFQTAFEKFDRPQVLIYDVPLLFERDMKGYFDLTVLVYAPQDLQRERLIKRDNQSPEMADTILNQQMNIEEKKIKADFVINNSKTEAELAVEVENFLRQIIET